MNRLAIVVWFALGGWNTANAVIAFSLSDGLFLAVSAFAGLCFGMAAQYAVADLRSER